MKVKNELFDIETKGALLYGTHVGEHSFEYGDIWADIREAVAEDFVEVKRVQLVDIAFYDADGAEIAYTVDETAVPDGYAGRTDVSAAYFSISPSSEWTTDVTINSKDADGNIIGQGVMTAVPLKRNRVTEYSGPLFSAGGEMTLTLNDEWDTPVSGTW